VSENNYNYNYPPAEMKLCKGSYNVRWTSNLVVRRRF